MATRGGIVVGPDHAHGGKKFPVTVMVDEEGGEVNIPRELLADTTVHTFRGSNKKILDRILRLAGLSVSDEVTDVRYGDIVICRRSVEDKTLRILTGTVEQLLDQVNQSNGCKPIAGSKFQVSGSAAKNGIRIPMHQKLKDWQIENPNSPRWQKKKERIQQLSSTISGLRGQLSRDIASDDEKTALTALVIAVMDKTAERVGNDDSADNGHFGVTGFRKNHISVVGSTVHLDYVGKSGTKHEKSFTDERIAKALKRAIKNSPSKFIFETSDGFRIKSDKVNRYLDEFGITAKDIRGYMANRWIIEKLKRQNSKVTSEQPDKAKKERKKIFNQALKETAAEVGHGRGTLKKHYMIPELPVEFIEHGHIIDMRNLGYFKEGGVIPGRYRSMGFERVGQKKRSTRPQKKWMVLARKGDKYKVVHGGEKGMEDFSQHRDKTRQARFWNRMGGFDSEKANDPFSPLYWHKKFGTWENGGVIEKGTVKVAWVDAKDPDIMESKMYEDLDTALAEARGKTFMLMELEDSGGDYYKWRVLPYGEYEKFKGLVSLNDIFLEEGGSVGNENKMCGCFHSYINENYPDLCLRLAEENINEMPELRAQVDQAYTAWKQ